MRKLACRAWLAFAWLAFVAACSDGPPEKTVNEIAIEENATLLCDRLFGCCSSQELDALPFIDDKRPPTHEGCVAYHTKTAREYLSLTESAAAAGRLALHVDRSADCIERLREESCTDFYSERLVRLHVADAFALCNEDVVEPLVDHGAGCESYLDCKAGFCDAAAKACKPFPKDGEACALDPGCDRGFRCDPETLRCSPYIEDGADCTDDNACRSGACGSGKCVSAGLCGG